MWDRELKEIRKQEQYRKAISCMEEEQYDKAIILIHLFHPYSLKLFLTSS